MTGNRKTDDGCRDALADSGTGVTERSGLDRGSPTSWLIDFLATASVVSDSESAFEPIQPEADVEGNLHFGSDWRLALIAVAPSLVFLSIYIFAQPKGFHAGFFAPFYMPWGFAAGMHLCGLPLVGIVYAVMLRSGRDIRLAGHWLICSAMGILGFPFLILPYDPVIFAGISMVVFAVEVVAVMRVSRILPRAALCISPHLAWLGLTAVFGIAAVFGWSSIPVMEV